MFKLSGPRAKALPYGLIFLGAAGVYLLWRSAYWFPDALRWELAVKTSGAQAVWHPHRLLYNACALAALAVIKGLGFRATLVVAMEVFDAVVGAAGVAVAFALVKRTGGGTATAIAGAAAVAFSCGYWSFACNAESVTPAAVAAMVTLLAAARATTVGGWRAWGAVGLAAGGAVLFHISNALLFIFVGAAAATVKPLPRAAKAALCAWAVMAGVVAAAYGAVAFGVLGMTGMREMSSWVVGGGGHPGFYTTLAARNILLDGFALARNLVAIKWMKDVAAYGWTPATGAAGAVTALLLVSFAALLVSAIGQGAREGRRWRTGYLAASFFIPYAAFFTFRDAGGWDRWLPQTVALWLVIYGGGGERPRWFGAARCLLPAALAAFNFVTAILPESKVENNPHVAYARFVATFAGPGDLIINGGDAGLGAGVYSEYFAGVRTTSFHLASLDEEGLRREVAAAMERGGDVFVGEGRAVLTSAALVAPEVGREYAADGPYARRLLRGYDWELFATYRGPGYRPSRFWRLRPGAADGDYRGDCR